MSRPTETKNRDTRENPAKNIKQLRTIREVIENFEESKLEFEAFNVKREESWQSLSYRQVRDQVKALGNALLKMGVKKGERIGLLSENRLEWPIVWLATTSIGAVIVPFDIFLTAAELPSVVNKSRVEIIFCSARCLEKTAEARPEFKKNIQTARFGRPLETEEKDSLKKDAPLCFSDLPETGKKLLEDGTDLYSETKVESEDAAALLFVSAGPDPISALISHRAFMANANAFLKGLGYPERERENWLAPLPLSPAYPVLFSVLIPLLTCNRATFISTSRMEPMAEAVRENKINYLIFVPSLLERLLEYLNKDKKGSLKEKGLDSLKTIFIAGAPSDKKIIEAMEALGVKVIEGYGLTETIFNTFNTAGRRRAGSVGAALDKTEVRIVDPDGDGNGEILVKGPALMNGYHDFEGGSKEFCFQQGRVYLDDKGWIHTGDIGRFDKDGFLSVSGRVRNIIVNKGGKNIYPGKIEAALMKSEYIEEALVIPKIYSNGGEYPYAIIRPDIKAVSQLELESGERFSDEGLKRLIEDEIGRLTSKTAHFKIPEEFEIYNNSHFGVNFSVLKSPDFFRLQLRAQITFVQLKSAV